MAQTLLGKLGVASLRAVTPAMMSQIATSDICGDLAMQQVDQAIAKAGITTLVVRLDTSAADIPTDLELLLDGRVVANIEQADKRRTIRIVQEIEPFDDSKVVQLTVRPTDGTKAAVRWGRHTTLTRGQTSTIEFDISQAPVLSTTVDGDHPLESNTFYAGDRLTLAAEHMGDRPNQMSFWLLLDPSVAVAQTLGRDHQTPFNTSSQFYGLDGWLHLRDSVDGELKKYLQQSHPDFRWQLLSHGLLPTRLLGTGDQITWTPQRELQGGVVVLVALGDDGYWGMSMRPIAVVDLRPGVWALPDLLLASGSPSPHQAIAGDGQANMPHPRVRDVQRIHDALSRMVFQAVQGQPARFMLHLGNYIDAELPLTSCTVRFGDGTTVDVPITKIAGHAVENTWTQSGIYDVTLDTADIMGFHREQGLRVHVVAQALEELEPTPEPEPKPEPTITLAKVSFDPAESSLSMFRRALKEWSARSVEAVNPNDGQLGVVLVHMHDRVDPILLDLADEALVRAFLANGSEVYERERARFNELQDNRLPHGVEQLLGLVPDAVPEHEWLVGDFERGKAVVTYQADEEGAEGGDAVRHTVLEVMPAIERFADVLDRVETVEPYAAPQVFDYKLRRAEVSFQPILNLPLFTRRARILGFVRLHDAQTYQVLGSDAVETVLTDIVAAPVGWEHGSIGWNSFAEDFLHNAHEVTTLQNPPS